MGKTKTTDVSPYATILVISARACRADVPLSLGGGVDVTTTGALGKVTVEIKVLREVDDDVVLELFAGREGGAPVIALGTTGEAGDVEVLTDEVRRRDEEELSELLNVAILDVVLTKLDEGKPVNVRLLLETGVEVELTLLDVAFAKPADDDATSVALLLDGVFGAMRELANGGVGSAGELVEVDINKGTLLELIELLKPGAVRMVVVEEVAISEVVVNTFVDELSVEMDPNDGRVCGVPIVGAKVPPDTVELAVGASELRVDVDASSNDDVAMPPDDNPLENSDVVLAGSKVLREEDADDMSDKGSEDAFGVSDVPIAVLGKEDDGVGVTTDDGISPDVVVVGAVSGVDGSSVSVSDVDLVLGISPDEMLGNEAARDDVAMVAIICPEPICGDVVGLPPTGLSVAGSGSDIVKPPLDDLTAELVPVAENPFEVDDIEGVGKDVALPTIEVAVLVDIAIWPPGRVEVSVIGKPAVGLDGVNVGGATLRIVVETIVIIVDCPSGRVVVIVVNRLKVVSDT